MKKNVLVPFVFAFLFIAFFSIVRAQPAVCLVNPQYTAPGIYPADTLVDMYANVATQQVIQFVWPIDLVYMGQTIPYDSFVISTVSYIPIGLNWQCNANHPVCHYICTPGQLTRGCITFYGIPTDSSPTYPDRDSIVIECGGYVTMFGGVQVVPQNVTVGYRISGPVDVASQFSKLGLHVAPNPVTSEASINYNLTADSFVRLSVIDLMGREIVVLVNETQRQGDQELICSSFDLTCGAYLLKINVNDGELVQMKKFSVVH